VRRRKETRMARKRGMATPIAARSGFGVWSSEFGVRGSEFGVQRGCGLRSLTFGKSEVRIQKSEYRAASCERRAANHIDPCALASSRKGLKSIMFKRMQAKREAYWLNHCCWCNRGLGDGGRISISSRFLDQRDYRKNAGKLSHSNCRASGVR
jgi:hypothetical protein